MPLVEELNEIGSLDTIRAEWSALLEQTDRANFFQTLEWLEVYWRFYGADQQLRVLVVRNEGRVAGILPLVVRQERTRIGPMRFLTYPLDYWGSFYGPIGGDLAATLVEGLRYVKQRERDWDALELRAVGASDGSCEHVDRAMTAAGFRPLSSPSDHTSIITLTGTWSDYCSSRSAKWRSNFRRLHRRFAEAGELEYVRYRPGGEAVGESQPRWDLYDACLRVARASWQGSSRTGTTLTHDRVRAFLREVHSAAARYGGLDINLLMLDGKPLAFNYNYALGGRVYGLRTGYDPNSGPAGSGNLLYWLAIKDSFARGDTLYDLGIGSLAAKLHLQTGLQPIYRYAHFPRSFRPQMLWIKRCFDNLRCQRRAAKLPG